MTATVKLFCYEEICTSSSYEGFTFLPPGHHCIDLTGGFAQRAPHQEPFSQKRPNPASMTFSPISLGAAWTCPEDRSLEPQGGWRLQGPVLPHAQQQGPVLPPARSFEDLGRGSEMLGGLVLGCSIPNTLTEFNLDRAGPMQAAFSPPK